jgi:hypothetical protein
MLSIKDLSSMFQVLQDFFVVYIYICIYIYLNIVRTRVMVEYRSVDGKISNQRVLGVLSLCITDFEYTENRPSCAYVVTPNQTFSSLISISQCPFHFLVEIFYSSSLHIYVCVCVRACVRARARQVNNRDGHILCKELVVDMIWHACTHFRAVSGIQRAVLNFQDWCCHLVKKLPLSILSTITLEIVPFHSHASLLPFF